MITSTHEGAQARIQNLLAANTHLDSENARLAAENERLTRDLAAAERASAYHRDRYISLERDRNKYGQTLSKIREVAIAATGINGHPDERTTSEIVDDLVNIVQSLRKEFAAQKQAAAPAPIASRELFVDAKKATARTVAVEVTGMADLERRVKSLERRLDIR